MDQSVEITLALGTNIGNKLQNLLSCLECINEQIGPIHKMSSIYQTEPWGNPNQDQFYNMVISGGTHLSPLALLRNLKNIETDLGRVTTEERYQPRIIDIDIIYYGNASINVSEPDLTIPHPFLQDREFVLIPLKEIQPLKLHPLLKYLPSELISLLGEHPQTDIIMTSTGLINLQNS